MAVSLGDDIDTIRAIYGELAGRIVGKIKSKNGYQFFMEELFCKNMQKDFLLFKMHKTNERHKTRTT